MTQKEAYINAVKAAHAARQRLFDQGNYTREDMLAANRAIQEALAHWARFTDL